MQTQEEVKEPVTARAGAKPVRTYVCKECRRNGVTTESVGRAALLSHYKSEHPDFKGKHYGTKVKTDSKDAQFGTIEYVRLCERKLVEAVKALDFERNQISSRLLELDDICSKYRKLG